MDILDVKRSNDENLKWWKKKNLLFNLTIILLLFLSMLLEKKIFPFIAIVFIMPVLIVFIIILNSVFFIIYGILVLISKKRLLANRQLRKLFLIFLSLSAATIIYFAIVEYKDLSQIKQRNKELDINQ